MSDSLRRALVEAIDSPTVERLAAVFAPSPATAARPLGEAIVEAIWPTLQLRLAQRLSSASEEQVAAGLREALDVMAENGVDGLSPFSEYPSPSETIRRVYAAMTAIVTS